MYKNIALLLLMVAGFSLSSQAQATQPICAGAIVPDGWVIIHISTDFCSGTSNHIETIEQISTLGTGATVNACAGNVPPAGWVLKDVATNFADCNNSSNDVWVLLNLNGEPPGAAFSVCSGQTLPSGWVVQNVATDFARCSGTNNNIWVLVDLNGLALNTQESVCAGGTLPVAWVISSTTTDFSRCFGTSNNIWIIVLTGSFSLSASPGSQTVLRGNTTSYNVSITRSAGFTGPISLGTSGLPSDANPTFNPNPAPGASSTLTVTGSANAITFHPTITGMSGNVPSNTQPQVTLQVTDFSLTLNPASLTVVQGGPGVQGQVIINSINGFSGSVQLGAVNVPSGVAFNFSLNPATTSSTMTVTADASSSATGVFFPTITGTSAGQVRPVGLASNLTLTVSGFTVSPCDHFIVQPGGSGTCPIPINRINGHSSPVTLRVSGLPSGTSATFSPNPTTTSCSTMTVTATASAAPGTYPLTVTGTDGNGVSRSGGTNLIIGTPSIPSRYIPLSSPCRIADTRNPNGPFGGPFLTGGVIREFDIPNSACNIPSTALSYALNATVVPRGPLGYLTLLPCGQPQPLASNLNSIDGRVKAVAAIIPAGTNNGVCVFPSNDTDLVLDISGYFVAASNPGALAFYPIAPCRIADTRNAPGPFGGPSLVGGATRNFPVLSSSCNLPSTAQAYSLNFTTVPAGFLGYFTAWPAGQTQPLASTLNAPTGTVVANAAIVQAGTNGDVSVFASNNSDLIIDINGYFAPPGPGGLSFIAVTPCRVLDTRNPPGSAPELDTQGPAQFPPINGTLAVNITGSNCGAPASALAYVLNATVVPPSWLGFITLWPDGTPQPQVSTLNAFDGAITSNMAIVPTNNGSIDVFVSNPTHVVLDIFGYFAP